MTYVPRTAPPLPKGPIPIRPVERRPSPFQDIRDRVNPEGSFTFSTDRSRIAAQRRARKVLDELDARRRGEAREERVRDRNRPRTPGQPRPRQPRIRSSSLILSDAELLKLFDEGKSCLQIQRLTGISQRTIRTRAHELGVHHPPTTRAPGMQRTDITADGMRALRAQGLGWRAIAAHYGVSYATIRRHRDLAGVHPTEKGIAA